jgi:hypothetical protein
MLVDWPNSIITGAALTKSNPFKWRHYQPEIILLCMRWYWRVTPEEPDIPARRRTLQIARRRPSGTS